MRCPQRSVARKLKQFGLIVGMAWRANRPSLSVQTKAENDLEVEIKMAFKLELISLRHVGKKQTSLCPWHLLIQLASVEKPVDASQFDAEASILQEAIFQDKQRTRYQIDAMLNGDLKAEEQSPELLRASIDRLQQRRKSRLELKQKRWGATVLHMCHNCRWPTLVFAMSIVVVGKSLKFLLVWLWILTRTVWTHSLFDLSVHLFQRSLLFWKDWDCAIQCLFRPVVQMDGCWSTELRSGHPGKYLWLADYAKTMRHWQASSNKWFDRASPGRGSLKSLADFPGALATAKRI